MKICKHCKESKPFDCFYKASTSKDGLQSHCKSCHSEGNKKRYLDNHEQNRARLSKYYYDNHEQEKENRRKHYLKNKATYLFNFYKREEKIKLATPDWLTEEMLLEIKQIYELSSKMTIDSGEQHHVDHIVPLQGKNVCGLHVPWNLQVLTAEENLRKSNIYESE